MVLHSQLQTTIQVSLQLAKWLCSPSRSFHVQSPNQYCGIHRHQLVSTSVALMVAVILRNGVIYDGSFDLYCTNQHLPLPRNSGSTHILKASHIIVIVSCWIKGKNCNNVYIQIFLFYRLKLLLQQLLVLQQRVCHQKMPRQKQRMLLSSLWLW